MNQKKTASRGILTKTDLEQLILHKSEETKHQAERIRAHLLSYLGEVPGKIERTGHEAIGEFALQVGNLILWLTGIIEPHAPPVEYGLNERAESLHGLGKQFRAVGLKLFNENSIRERNSIAKLKMDMELLSARLATFESIPQRTEAA